MAQREESWIEVVLEGRRELNGSVFSDEVMGVRSMLGEDSPSNYEMIYSNLEDEGNFLNCFRSILTLRAGFVHSGPHTTPSLPKALWKARLAVRHLGMHPSPAMSLLGASQGTPLSKAPLLCCKRGNDSNIQMQLSGEAEEAMCVKHFLLCLVLLLTPPCFSPFGLQ